MKKFFAILLCACTLLALVACDFGGAETETTSATTTEPAENENPTTEAEYKLGMGVVVDMESSKAGTAQVDATVAAVVLDADGKIVVCRIDVAQNKFDLANDFGAEKTFKTKMELGDDYNMAKYGQNMDWNGDGVVKEWYDQAKAFEAYVVGMTAAQVKAIETKVVEGAGYVIAADDALLSAGCTIQITDFIEAVAKACEDEQGMSFKTAEKFTLGVAATTAVDSATKAATAEENGTVAMYSDFAASVVAGGKIIATLNDAIQPKITVDAAGEIVEKSFTATKRELKEGYNMATYGASMDPNGDGVVYEWYIQSETFSKHVVGMTADEVAAMGTAANSIGYQMSTDADLVAAGCTIQITAIKAVVAQSAKNAR